jgi:glycosyltransferase 2 family protein
MKKYLGLIGVIIFLVILTKIDLSKFWSNLSEIKFSLFIFAVLLNIPQLFLKAYRWNQLLKKQSIQYGLKDSFFVYLSSLFIGIVTPSRVGEFVKALYLKIDKKISISRAVSSVLVDRLLDIYLLIVLGTIGLWKLQILKELSNFFLILAAFSVFLIVLLNKKVMQKFFGLFYRFTILKKFKENINEKFKDFYDGISELISFKLFFPIILTCLSSFLFFIQCYIIVIAMGLSIDFLTIIFFMAVANLISFVPISIFGLGTRDAVLIYFFSFIGLNPETAVSYSFLIFITFFVCGGLMGLVAWWIKPINISFLKHK